MISGILNFSRFSFRKAKAIPKNVKFWKISEFRELEAIVDRLAVFHEYTGREEVAIFCVTTSPVSN